MGDEQGALPADPAKQAAAHLFDYLLSAAVHERMHTVCDASGVPVQVAKALILLEPDVPKPMGALAEEWRCDASWVTALVDGLEEQGFAERRVQPQDRRVRTVALTPMGVKARDDFLDRLHDPPAAFSVLSEDELVALRDILRKILDASA